MCFAPKHRTCWVTHVSNPEFTDVLSPVLFMMQMRAGLHDYNDTWYRSWTFEHPHRDWGPFDILHALNKEFICAPGTCGSYSSPGYELLGLALW